jgi:hypothetical protein
MSERGGAIVPARRPETVVTVGGSPMTDLRREVDHVRALASPAPSRFLRRVLFMWFRVFVSERKAGKEERVNVRIPIPIPIVGLLLPYGVSQQHALKALAAARDDPEPEETLARYLESVMAVELVRVDERSSATGKRSTVVVGFD